MRASPLAGAALLLALGLLVLFRGAEQAPKALARGPLVAARPWPEQPPREGFEPIELCPTPLLQSQGAPHSLSSSPPSATAPEGIPTAASPTAPTPAPAPPEEYLAPPPTPWLAETAMAWAGPLFPEEGGSAAPTTAPRRELGRDVGERLLEDGLRARDERLGIALPAAGNVASALATTVRWHTPPESSARFVAHIGSDGRLSNIAVGSFSGGIASMWRDAAASAERQLDGLVCRLRPPFEGGALVTVHIQQELTRPTGSGRLPRPEPVEALSRWPFAPRIEPRPSVREEGTALALSTDMANLGNPETMMPPLATCIPNHERDCPAGPGAFDLGDLGTSPARVVRTRIEVAPAASRLGPRAG